MSPVPVVDCPVAVVERHAGHIAETTTITVSVRMREALRQLADRKGLAFDAPLEKPIRRERRRLVGAQLSGVALVDDDGAAVLNAWASDVADEIR